MVIEYDGDFVVVDCGVVFPENDILGMDSLIPDVDWILENAERCLGVVLTHGHEDHIGSMPYLLRELDAPVYGTPLTIAMLERKLEEHGLLADVDLYPVRGGERTSFGKFEVEFVRVNHSIPDAAAIAIHTPMGTVVHTGDFRFDHTPVRDERTDIKRLAEIGESGVLLLLSDSTNVERPGSSTSEASVRDALTRVIAEARRRVWITMFSSNIHRLQGILESAHACGRKVLVIGRSLRNNLMTALDMGYIVLPSPDILVEMHAFGDIQPSKIVVVCTGSQGEPRSALSAIARRGHRFVHVDEGDVVVFSARVIPGNDRSVGNLQDQMYRMGAEVITSREAPVHTTGHAHQEEQKLMISLLRPRFFVPIHGDYRMLVKHARIAADLGVPHTQVIDTGDVLQVTPDAARVVGRVRTGKVFVDGRTLASVNDEVLKERRRIARSGVLVAMVGVDMEDGSIVTRPEFIQVGAVESALEEEVLEECVEFVLARLDKLPRRDRLNVERLSDQLQQATRQYFRRRFDRKPWVIPIISEY